MIKRSIHIVSTFIGSIGEISEDLILSLSKDFIITIEGRSLPGELDILLCHYYNKEIVMDEIFSKFKKKVLIQPLDGTHLKESIVLDFNKFDLIITPATAGKKILENNGVTCEIEVIPNYYKTDILSTEIYSELDNIIPKDKIVFYHESNHHNRKGIDLLYSSFIKAFSDTPYHNKVILIFKDVEHEGEDLERVEELKKQSMLLQSKYKKPVKIYKITQNLPQEKLKNLWHRMDFYVSFSKIEGFGIPMLRACFLKKPVICLDNRHSGYNDFLTSRNAYLVPTFDIKESTKNSIYTEDSLMVIPRASDSIDALRLAVKEFAVSKRAGLYGKENKFLFETVIKQYITLLNKK